MKGEVESSLDEGAKKEADKIAFLAATSQSARAILKSEKKVVLKLIVNEVEEPARLMKNCGYDAKTKIVRPAHDDDEKQPANRRF